MRAVPTLSCCLALVLLAPCAWGQEDAKPGDLADEALSARIAELGREARAASSQLEEAEARAVKDLAALDATRARLAELTEPVAAELPADAPVWDRAEAQQHWREARLEVSKARLRLLEELDGELKPWGARLGELIQDARALDARLGVLAPLLAELTRRNEGRAESLPQPAGASELGPERQAALGETIARWQAEQAQLPTQLADLEARIAARQEELGTRGEELSQARVLRAEALQRKGLSEAFAANDGPTLLSLLGRKVEDQKAGAQRIEEAASEVRSADARVEELLRRLQEQPAPNPDAIRVKAERESVREAKKALELERQRLAYHREREVLRDRLAEAIEIELNRLDELLPELEAVRRMTLEVDVLRDSLGRLEASGEFLVPELPRRAEEALVQDELLHLRRLAGSLGGTARDRQQQLDDSQAHRAKNHELIVEIEGKLPELEQTLQVEEELVKWSAELEGLADPALIERFAQAEAEFAEALEASRQAAAGAQAISDAEHEVNKALHELVDPLSRAFALRLNQRRKEVFEALAAGRPEQIPARRPAQRPVEEEASSGEAEDEVFKREIVSQSFYDALARVSYTFEGRLKFLEARDSFQHQKVELLQARIAALNTWEGTVQAALSAARNTWAAAMVLSRRRLAGEAAPSGLNEALSLDRADALRADVERIEAREAELTDEVIRLEAVRRVEEGLRVQTQHRLDLVVRKLECLDGLHELNSARVPGEPSEVEKDRRKQAIVSRLEGEDRWYDTLLVFAESERAGALTALLEGYYGELIELERRSENIGARTRGYEQLQVIVGDQRGLLDELLPVLTRRRDQLRLIAAVERLRAIVAWGQEPALRQDAAAELSHLLDGIPAERRAVVAGARRIAPVTGLSPEEAPRARERWAERVFAAQAAWLAFEQRLIELEQARGGPGRSGHLASQILGIENLISELSASNKKIEARKQKLQGAAEAKGPGLIAVARDERRQARVREARKTLVLLAFIPLFAWLAYRFARAIGMRLVQRVKDAISDDDDVETAVAKREREERAETLYEVFTKVWTIVVVILAVIYFLKALGLDVTPLIASAGIIGLAVAFGSQALVRDFFAGFFILLEDQYSIGDYVTVDGVGGTVERITLRLTILRDLKGTLHFIPNGSVTVVSNFTKDWARAVLDVGIPYGDDPDAAIACMEVVGERLRADADLSQKILDYTVLGVQEFGEHKIIIRALAKVRPGDQWGVAREARRLIKHTFQEHGIQIPIPQRVVFHRYEFPQDAQGPEEEADKPAPPRPKRTERHLAIRSEE